MDSPEDFEPFDLEDINKLDEFLDLSAAEVVEFKQNKILQHLRGRDFKKKFDSHLRRPSSEAGTEQGFFVCSGLDRKKLTNQEIQAADFDTSFLGYEDLEKRDWFLFCLFISIARAERGFFPTEDLRPMQLMI